MILLGLRTAINLELNTTPTQMVYGSELRLPGKYFMPGVHDEPITNPRDFVDRPGASLRLYVK